MLSHYLLDDLALNPLIITGQTTAISPKLTNPLTSDNNAQQAAKRLTSNVRLPNRAYPNRPIIIDTDDFSSQ